MKKLNEKWYVVSGNGLAVRDGDTLSQAWGRYKFNNVNNTGDVTIYHVKSKFRFTSKGAKPRWNEAQFRIENGIPVVVNCELEVIHGVKDGKATQ